MFLTKGLHYGLHLYGKYVKLTTEKTVEYSNIK